MKKGSGPHAAWQELKLEAKRRPRVTAVYLILRLIVLVTMVSAILRQEYESVFICLLVLVLFLLPFFLQKKFRFELPDTLEIIILLFIFAAEILGELQCYFVEYPHWDTMLHTTSGFLAAAVGFSLVDLLNRDAKIKFQLSPLYVAIAAFCFARPSASSGSLLSSPLTASSCLICRRTPSCIRSRASCSTETNRNIPIVISNIESASINGVDLGLGGYLDIGLYDTMEDLFVSFVGAVTFSVIGYFYLKKHGQGTFVRQFIPTIREDDTADHEEKTDDPETGDGI